MEQTYNFRTRKFNYFKGSDKIAESFIRDELITEVILDAYRRVYNKGFMDGAKCQLAGSNLDADNSYIDCFNKMLKDYEVLNHPFYINVYAASSMSLMQIYRLAWDAGWCSEHAVDTKQNNTHLAVLNAADKELYLVKHATELLKTLYEYRRKYTSYNEKE